MSNIIRVDYTPTMEKSYTEYALSVIMGRALPDVRDGLKWVHRRILFSMWELGLIPEKGYRKCARIVGDTLGKYHPHGDSSVYGALVRLAQEWSLRYMLVDGHGNFGSVDGDNPAHMRYTEAKMQKIALEMLRDIHKDTIDFIPNFDEEEQEPTVLPSRFPNFLVNGSSGIAVGMATNVPTHNLSDVIDAVIYQIDNPLCSIGDLVDIIKAPDFPTGGQILNPKDMVDMYTKGYGRVIMRAKYHIEVEKDLASIIVTELPYKVVKSKLVEAIYLLTQDVLVKDKSGKEKVTKAKTDGIKEVLDESDRNGIRVRITLKKNVSPDKILPILFKHSDLQCSFGANFTAIYKTNNLLEHLNLKDINMYYINHQKEVISRRTQFDLDKCAKRLHLLEGLKKALLELDETIKLIRGSKNKSEASGKLVTFLQVDESQADYILSLKLHRLTGMEVESLDIEHRELVATVAHLSAILNTESELLNVLKTELLEIKSKYGDERRTELVYQNKVREMTKEDLIEDFNCKIVYTQGQYIKKILKTTDLHKLKDDDLILEEVSANNRSMLYLLTNKANRYKIPCSDLETCNTPSKTLGEYIPNMIDLEDGEKVIKVLVVDNEKEAKGFVVYAFENGKVAKIDIQSFVSSTKKLVNCFNKDSQLMAVEYVEENVDVLMVSEEGKALIMSTFKINAKGSKSTQGVNGMNLGDAEDNKVVFAKFNPPTNLMITVKTLKGKSKDFIFSDIAPTGRDTEERDLYTYVSGNPNNQGSFILNTRKNNDKLVDISTTL